MNGYVLAAREALQPIEDVSILLLSSGVGKVITLSVLRSQTVHELITCSSMAKLIAC